ncbi:MAG TPA: branched-chain amino acid ABC transporter permease [Micromonosporaceae bacterium]
MDQAVTGVETAARGSRRVTRSTLLLTAWVVAGLAVVLALVYALGGKSPALVTQAVVTGVLLGGVYALVSIGLTLIFGVLGIVNFAQGTLLTLSMYLVYALSGWSGMNVYLATLVAIPLLFGLGWLIQTTMLNRLMSAGETEGQLLVTLGLSLLIGNVLLLAFGGQPKSAPAPWNGNLTVLGAVAQVPRVVAFAGAILLVVALTVLLRRTRLGLAIRSVAAQPQGAALVGVNVRAVYALTFGLGAACVGAAGGLVLPFLSLTPSAGEQFTILAFVIVVLGGLGSVTGALVGGLTIGLVQTVGGLYLPGTGALLLVFAVFVLVLFLRPQGLFGSAQ